MKPEYGKRSRYPKLNRDANGKAVCRGCQGAVPKGRQTWCSNACYDRYGHVWGIKLKCWQRDKGLCQMCHRNVVDMAVESRRYTSPRQHYRLAEYDHIVPHSEGGLFVLENLRTLCHACHVKRTTQWRKTRSLKVTPEGQIEMRL